MAKEFAKKFYKSTTWLKCRASYIASIYGLCERCEGPGHILHHKIELNTTNINDADVTLNHDNLEYLCLTCHNNEHNFDRDNKKSCTRKDFKFNSNGELMYISPL